MAKPRVTKPKSKVGGVAADVAEDRFTYLRAICFGLPAVEEKLSHGSPAFFVRGKMFAMFVAHGHGDGRVAVWCKAELARQAELVGEDAARYFVPPYVGVKGWVGVRLEGQPDWEALTILIEEGWTSVAPASVANEPVMPAPPTGPISRRACARAMRARPRSARRAGRAPSRVGGGIALSHG